MDLRIFDALRPAPGQVRVAAARLYGDSRSDAAGLLWQVRLASFSAMYPVDALVTGSDVLLQRAPGFLVYALDFIADAVQWSRLPGAGQGFMPIEYAEPIGDENAQARTHLLGGVGDGEESQRFVR